MENKYKPIRVSEFKSEHPEQLDRIEKKVDRILKLLEDKELSTSDKYNDVRAKSFR